MKRAVPRSFWKKTDNVDKLKMLAATRMPAPHIATMMQIPVSSVISKALSLGIALERFTEEEIAERRVRLREISRIKQARKKATAKKVSILPPLPRGVQNGLSNLAQSASARARDVTAAAPRLHRGGVPQYGEGRVMPAPLRDQHQKLKQEYDAAKPHSGIRTFVHKQMSKVVLADLKLSLKGSRKRKAA